MVQLIRVYLNLPPDHRERIALYLNAQPLLPRWELSAAPITTTTRPLLLVDLTITTPTLLRCSPDQVLSGRIPVVLVLERSAKDDLTQVIGAAGVRGLIFSDDPPETLALCIAVAATHGVWVPELLWRGMAREAEADLVSNLRSLTRAEAETLRFLAEGMTYPQIARARHVQTSTVKYHVDNVRRKLSGGSRQQLMALLYRSGITL